MRLRRASRVLLVVTLAACSGGTGVTTFGNPSAASGVSATAPPFGGGNRKVDCAVVKTAAQQLLQLQILVQLKTPDAVAQVKAKQIGNLDLPVLLAAMHDLHALDPHGSPLGDAKTAIDFYEKAGMAAQVLFATDPVTQAAIDTYNQNVGPVADFLGHQLAISGAMSAAGCG